ncbi:MAG: PD-(D/E)XK nuclease family protein, partial [Bacteroidota bacterium]
MKDKDSIRYNSFLYRIAQYLRKNHPEGMDDQCILFPNRRAGLFFKKYYAEISDKSSWLPEIYTIGDFMNRLSGLQAADPLELSFETYRSYKKLTGSTESYDEFYPWGEMMVSDFNDIDKYLVDAEQLFTNVNDLKEIEQIFDYLDQDQKQLISRFWKNFETGELSGQKESFLFIWKILFPVYEDFKKNLIKKELGYEGMIYRIVAEDIISHPDFSWQWSKINICGFNALSKAEEKLFAQLRDAGKASFFWDYDPSFINDTMHEAGRFLRSNIRRFPAVKDFTLQEKIVEEEKDINIFSLPSDVLQTKQLHEILNELNSDEEEIEKTVHDFNRTAVILGDETLLPAILTSIPQSVGRLNITMGFPVSQTPVYSFIEAVLKMQQNLIRRKNNQKFYFRDILSVLNHQYIKTFYQDKAAELVDRIHREN